MGKKIPVSVLVVMYSPSGRFLLIERADKAGYWQSVTGSLDVADEPPIQAAVRELAEETGFLAHAQADSPALLGLPRSVLCTPLQLRAWPHSLQYEIFEHWRHRYPEGVTHNTEHWFAVCLPEDAVPLLAPTEHLAYGWFEAQEAAAKCFSPNNAQAILDLHKALSA